MRSEQMCASRLTVKLIGAMLIRMKAIAQVMILEFTAVWDRQNGLAAPLCVGRMEWKSGSVLIRRDDSMSFEKGRVEEWRNVHRISRSTATPQVKLKATMSACIRLVEYRKITAPGAGGHCVGKKMRCMAEPPIEVEALFNFQ